MSLLTLHNLSKRYGETVAVNTIDLEVPAGSRTAIVGPSGCGKTTLLRMIAGFETPDSGKVVLGGNVLVDGALAMPAHKRSIGYVAQEGALFPHMTVSGNISFGLDRREPDRDRRVGELMDRVELPRAMADRRPHEISGGQQQRVALARALARKPRLMLLDEPFSALDAGLRGSMRDMVGRVLSAAGVTTVLVTHDQAEALSFAEHLVVMRDGEVVQSGSPQQVYLKPRDAVTAGFLGEAIILDADIAEGWANWAFGRVPIDEARQGKARLLVRPEQIQLRAAGADLANARIVSLAFQGPTCRVVVRPLDGAPGGAISLLVSRLLDFEAGSPVRLEIAGPVHIFA